MMRAVDCTQTTSAYITDDGGKTGGLIEFPRNYREGDWSPDDGPHPRVARTTGPKLHSELEGESIVLFKHFGDALSDDDEDETESDDDDSTGRYRKHYGDVLWDDGNGGVILTQEDDVLEAEVDRIEDTEQWLEFHEPEGGWGDADESDADGGADGDGGSTFDFDELDGDGDTDSGSDELTMDDLDADTYGFIQEARDYAERSGGIDEAFGSWESTVQSAIEGGEIESYEPDELRMLVEDQL